MPSKNFIRVFSSTLSLQHSDKGPDGRDQGPNVCRASFTTDGDVKTYRASQKNVDSVKIAYRPEGVGLFRDPLDILGSRILPRNKLPFYFGYPFLYQ